MKIELGMCQFGNYRLKEPKVPIQKLTTMTCIIINGDYAETCINILYVSAMTSE